MTTCVRDPQALCVGDSTMHTIATPWMWTGFAVFVLAALAIDLRLMKHSGPHAVTTREALWWSALWVALAMLFNGLLWWLLDAQSGRAVANEVALQFLTGYLVEKSLAVDNIFVFLMLFTYFAVPSVQQQRVRSTACSCDRAARDHDLHRRGADRAVPLDPLRVRCLPGDNRAEMLWAAGQAPDLERIRCCAG